MEVSLYSQKSIDAMSEVERLRAATQLQKKIIGDQEKIIEDQEEIIGSLKRKLAAMESIIKQLHQEHGCTPDEALQDWNIFPHEIS